MDEPPVFDDGLDPVAEVLYGRFPKQVLEKIVRVLPRQNCDENSPFDAAAHALPDAGVGKAEAVPLCCPGRKARY